MKLKSQLIALALLVSMAACKKDDKADPAPAGDTYSSLEDFFTQHEPKDQTYTLNASLGGTFTTPQGTIVTVPVNAFVTQANAPVTGNVTIKFRDLYKKSDMFFARKPTVMSYGQLLKSGGEFYISVMAGNESVKMASGKSVDVEAPGSLTGGVDQSGNMGAFVSLDTAFAFAWDSSTTNNVFATATSYMYSIFALSPPPKTYTWINVDDPIWFSSFQTTSFQAIPNYDLALFPTNIYLIYDSVTTITPLRYYPSAYYHYYSPVGLGCTMVAVSVGTQDNSLYSAFIPFTVTPNLSVPFNLTKTTTEEFKAKLSTLN